MLATLKRLFSVLPAPFLPRMIILAVLLVATTGLETINVGLLFYLFRIVLDPTLVASSSVLASIQDFFALSETAFLLFTCLAVVSVFFLKTAFSLSASIYKLRLIWVLQKELSIRLFTVYLRRPYSFHLQSNSAVLLRNVTGHVSLVTQVSFQCLIDFIADALLLVCLCALLIATEPRVSLWTIGMLGIFGALFVQFGRRFFRRWGEQANRSSAALYQLVSAGLSTIKEIKVFGRDPFFIEKLSSIMTTYSTMNFRNMVVQQFPRPLLEGVLVLGATGTIAALLASGRSLAESMPTLVLFGAAAYRLLPAIVRMAAIVQNLRFAGAGLDAVTSELQQRDEPGNADTALERPVFEREIGLNNVSFRYEGEREDALRDVTLSVARGEVAAFVGPSGAGKSTTADILLGVLSPSSGFVVLDGRQCSPDGRSQRRLFGYVPQTTVLLDDTIRRNIAFGIPDNSIDDDKVRRATEMAQLTGFIASLPQGYETVVGDDGARLSGGQRQRISIARALYDDPDILLFDEATSALDASTEAEVSKALDSLKRKKTLIIIAHRLSTIRDSDRIFYFDAGKLADSGQFDSLLQRHQGFRAMAAQMGLSENSDILSTKLSARSD